MAQVHMEQANDDAGVRYVTRAYDHRFAFSVCSLVASQEKYDRLLASFRAKGFTPENSEFLAADNRHGNQFDGYDWQRRLYPECSGKYVIFCHDDVEMIDEGFDVLFARLEALTDHDPLWMLAGNAGGRHGHAYDPDAKYGSYLARSLQGKWRRFAIRRPFVRVESLDENFIIMRREMFVSGSVDLGGFHHYGPDLCMVAEILGGRSYVVDFTLKHYGTGDTGEAYQSSRDKFAAKYKELYPGRVLVTTTGPVVMEN